MGFYNWYKKDGRNILLIIEIIITIVLVCFAYISKIWWLPIFSAMAILLNLVNRNIKGVRE